MSKILPIAILILICSYDLSQAETGVERCIRLNETLGLDLRACEDAIVGSKPDSQDADDIMKDLIRRDIDKKRKKL